MKDYNKLAASYTRAMTIAQEVCGKLPEDAAFAVEGIERLIREGDNERASLELRRLVREVVNPLALTMRKRIDRAHKEVMELLRWRLQLLEMLHTIASAQQQFDKCAQFASEMEILNGFLLEDFLKDV